MFKKTAMSISMLIIIILFMTVSCAIAETIIYDHSNDTLSYAKKVALLNQQQIVVQIEEIESISTTQMVALLCKTDGSDIDFNALSPEYIVAGPNNHYTLFFLSIDQCHNAVEVLDEVGGIIYAEADCEVYSCSTRSEDAQSFYSWGASQMNLDRYIGFTNAWGSGNAEVAVIDSGVFPHSLIKGKLLQSGYDYVDADEDALNDLFGHGTSVAGIIADCTADESVYIYPIRVLNASGKGKMSNVVNAVREAKNYGVDVINLSLESAVMSAALDDAILEAVSSGIAVVVAAGNSACDTSEVCPAHLSNSGVIVVGAAEGSEGSYRKASYSNYGSSVDVYAFGTDINCCSLSGGFSNETGTSMAAPHISAISALMNLIHPNISPGQIERRLQLAAIGTGSIVVPDSAMMIPSEEGFNLSVLKMNEGDSLSLSSKAYPFSSCETISFTSSDENVVVYKDGCLMALTSGVASVTAKCIGFEDQLFQVIVDKQPETAVLLPEALGCIEDEAFYGATRITHLTVSDSVREIGNRVFENCDGLRLIYIPGSVTSIGDNSFSEAVVMCEYDSFAHGYVKDKSIQYVITD